MKRFLWALALLFASCGREDFEAIFITNATLTIQHTTMMVIAGGTGGEGTLSFTLEDGSFGSCPVSLRGPVLGIVMQFSSSENTMTLSLPEASVPLSDVFGGYRGTGAGGYFIIGGETHSATNGRGVSIDDTDGGFGFGVYVGVEVLRLKPPNIEDCTF